MEKPLNYSAVGIAFRLMIVYNKYYSNIFKTFESFIKNVDFPLKNTSLGNIVIMPICKYLFKTQISNETGLRIVTVNYLRSPVYSLFPMTIACPAIISSEYRHVIYDFDNIPFAVYKAIRYCDDLKISISRDKEYVFDQKTICSETPHGFKLVDPNMYIHGSQGDMIRFINSGEDYVTYLHVAANLEHNFVNLNKSITLFDDETINSCDNHETWLNMHVLERCMYELNSHATSKLFYGYDKVKVGLSKLKIMRNVLQRLQVMVYGGIDSLTMDEYELKFNTIHSFDVMLIEYIGGWKSTNPINIPSKFLRIERRYAASALYSYYVTIGANDNPPLSQAMNVSSFRIRFTGMASKGSSLDSLLNTVLKLIKTKDESYVVPSINKVVIKTKDDETDKE